MSKVLSGAGYVIAEAVSWRYLHCGVDLVRGISGRQNDTGTVFSCSIYTFPAVHCSSNVPNIVKCPVRFF